jgi:preprotein translocase subunit SecE
MIISPGVGQFLETVMASSTCPPYNFGRRVWPETSNSKQMKKIINYLKDSYNELVHKVTWPTWKELQNSAIIVMIASLIFALVVFVMDISFQTILEGIYKLV